MSNSKFGPELRPVFMEHKRVSFSRPEEMIRVKYKYIRNGRCGFLWWRNVRLVGCTEIYGLLARLVVPAASRCGRLRLKNDGTRAETRFRLSAKSDEFI